MSRASATRGWTCQRSACSSCKSSPGTGDRGADEPGHPVRGGGLDLVRAAAQAGDAPRVFEARTADQVSSQVEAAAKAGATGLLVLEDPLTYSTRRPIAVLAAQFRLPTIYGTRSSLRRAADVLRHGAGAAVPSSRRVCG